MILLAVAMVVLQWAVVGYLLFDARRERDAHARVLAEFTLAAHGRERELLNRIKPETAQYPIVGTGEQLEAVGWDDDDDFIRAAGLSKEELAERAFEAETG